MWLQPPKDAFVRVPDGILKTAVFLGLDTPEGRQYGGTGYIVSVDYGPGYVFTVKNDAMTSTSRYPLMFLVTAGHIAEKLEGYDFYIRANYKDGSLAEIKQDCSTRWWYHPTERDSVDVALMLLPAAEVLSLDIAAIPVTLFLSDEMIKSMNLGIGDEVFMPGLFKNAKGRLRNIPIVRIGNVAMIPEEKISFSTPERPDQRLYANLLESRSIGGLSGSPVFIRETIKIKTGFRMKPGFFINAVNSPTPEETGMELVELSGTGRFQFFGSVIGHWQVSVEFSDTKKEAVNMGIAPMVPASKILEVLWQPELIAVMNELNAQTHEKVQNQEGAPVLDDAFGKPKDRPFTKEDFETALKKASRKKA